jgi:hypothetical protein
MIMNTSGILFLDSLVMENILSFLTPYEVTHLELVNTTLRILIQPLWQCVVSNFPQLEYLLFRKYQNITAKELALMSWSAYQYHHGICVQIGGLCPQSYQRNKNLFAFRDFHVPNFEDCTHELFQENEYPLHFQSLVAPAIEVDSFGRPVTFGGWLSEDEESTPHCYLFTPSSGWALFHRLDEPLCFASSSRLITGEILVCGGGETIWRGSGVTTATELYRIPLEIDPIHPLNPTPLAPLLYPRCGHRTVTHFNGQIYAVGGYGGGTDYYSSGESFSLAQNQWFPISSMTERRSGAGLGLGQDGALYCAGGSSNGSDCSDTIERYDPRCDEWTLLTGRMNEARGYVSACFNSQGNILYVAGGISQDNILPSIEWYDIRMNRWEYLVVDDMSAEVAGYQRGDYSMMHLMPGLMSRY